LDRPLAGEVPFLADAGPKEPSPPPSPPVARADAGISSATADPVAPSPPTSGRLARGLASFSRENAQREKKYAHLLRDAKSGKAPSGSGKPG
jgi:hypothetical protein